MKKYEIPMMKFDYFELDDVILSSLVQVDEALNIGDEIDDIL